MRALAAAALLTVTVAACGSDSPSSRSDPQARGPAAAPSPFSDGSFPSAGCVDSVAQEAELWEAAAVAPPEVQREPKPQDAGWLPGRLVDLAVLDDGYAVADAMLVELTRFSPDLTERKQWGRKGAGPGEFAAPAAVAAGPGGEIWVLDEMRVSVFDRAGAFVRSFRLRTTGIDLAVDEAGRAYVAHVILPDFVRRDARWGTLVTVLDPDGGNPRELVRVTPSDLEPPRFVLPGPTHVRLAARGGRVAVAYTAAGIVDVYRDGERVATAASCVPDALADAYERQRRAGGNAQQYVHLVTDVLLDDDGTIHLVGPIKDQEGRYHIDRFSAAGEPLGSIVMPGAQVVMPNEVRFGSLPAELVGFDTRGVVARFEVRSPQARR